MKEWDWMESLGRYRILGELGRGAMGIVYRAQDPAIGRIVAIKTIRLNDLVDASERAKLGDRLQREAQSAGVLSHPGIVTIYDVAEQDGLAYVTMEFVDGPTLERIMVSNPPDGRFLLDILAQTAAALDYAHKRGIVHRDIKPANIMIHEGSTAKIADFGVARIQSQQMTQIGSVVGTPSYMSPEQIQGLEVDGRSDQFSLAVIAYELLAGEKPFSGESIPSLAFKIVHEDPVAVHRLNPTLDWPVDTVLKRALSKDPQNRYATCSEFASTVENACRSIKGWAPAAAASLQSLPTIGVARPVLVDVGEREDAESEPPPRALKWARSLAVTVVAGGAIILASIGTFRWLNDEELPEPSNVRDETEAAPPSSTRRAEERIIPSAPAAIPDAYPEPDRRLQAAASATIRLVTNPSGASLVLDDDPAASCTSPCSVELSSGRHTLAATLEGHRKALRIFEVPETEELFVNLDATTGSLVVRSEPGGASIRVDGRDRSERTPALLTLPTGRHRIEIIGEKSREVHEVTIGDSTMTNLAVNLP